MVKPAQLLENLGVVGVTFKHASVGGLGRVVLQGTLVLNRRWDQIVATYILLLFVHVTNLEPDVFLAQRLRRVGHNVTEALLLC